MEKEQRARRLCSEIQLFDLCDLDTCCQKDGRFCTNEEVLERFEAIKEEDERELYLAEESEEDGEDEELEEMLDDGEEAEGYDDDDR